MLFWQDTRDQSAKVPAAVEFLGAPEQDVGGCGRVGDYDPGSGEGGYEGLDDGGRVPGCQGGEPALINGYRWTSKNVYLIVVCILVVSSGRDERCGDNIRIFSLCGARSSSFPGRRRRVYSPHRGCKVCLATVWVGGSGIRGKEVQR